MPRDWLRELLGVFPSNSLDASEFEVIPPDALPPTERRLLDHDQHMTVTLEAHHGAAVHLNVIEVHREGNEYARRLTLSAGPDGPIILAGIMCFNLEYCGDDVRRRILEANTPLGRILIEHGVMRRIQTEAFLRIPIDSAFCRLFGLTDSAPPGATHAGATHAHGRLAIIFCNTLPAVELLEVVPPAV